MEYSIKQGNIVTERQILHNLTHMHILASGVCVCLTVG